MYHYYYYYFLHSCLFREMLSFRAPVLALRFFKYHPQPFCSSFVIQLFNFKSTCTNTGRLPGYYHKTLPLSHITQPRWIVQHELVNSRKSSLSPVVLWRHLSSRARSDNVYDRSVRTLWKSHKASATTPTAGLWTF